MKHWGEFQWALSRAKGFVQECKILSMNIVSWKIRGLWRKEERGPVRRFIKEIVDLLHLQQTKLEEISEKTVRDFRFLQIEVEHKILLKVLLLVQPCDGMRKYW